MTGAIKAAEGATPCGPIFGPCETQESDGPGWGEKTGAALM
jgi:hypothetical protein